jgi:hypothetical protein
LLRQANAAVQNFYRLARIAAAAIHNCREGAISGTIHPAPGQADRLGQAWQALRHDPSVQFNLSPPPSPPKPPAWLEAISRWLGKFLELLGRAIEWIFSFLPAGPYAQILLWTLIVAGAGALLWALFNRLRHGRWSLKRQRLASSQDWTDENEWTPEAAGARSWLEEADALAREGRYGEAIHHLLFRSIEDISNRRPALVRPALTSRELARSEGIPGRARELFAGIARLVERSLFGGRPVHEGDWLAAREAYSDFALPAAWRG